MRVLSAAVLGAAVLCLLLLPFRLDGDSLGLLAARFASAWILGRPIGQAVYRYLFQDGS